MLAQPSRTVAEKISYESGQAPTCHLPILAHSSQSIVAAVPKGLGSRPQIEEAVQTADCNLPHLFSRHENEIINLQRTTFCLLIPLAPCIRSSSTDSLLVLEAQIAPEPGRCAIGLTTERSLKMYLELGWAVAETRVTRKSLCPMDNR